MKASNEAENRAVGENTERRPFDPVDFGLAALAGLFAALAVLFSPVGFFLFLVGLGIAIAVVSSVAWGLGLIGVTALAFALYMWFMRWVSESDGG